MCTRSFQIFNKSKERSTFAFEKKIDIPCGECLSCEYDYGDQWQLRCHQEIYDCLERGGDCIFITLTYRPKYLPTFFVCGTEMPCFSYDHIKVFMREMRRSLGNSDDLRFFITGEYGDQTFRSHYHGLLFFPPSLSHMVQMMRPCSSKTQAFKDFIQSFWPYGFCRWSKPESKGGPGIFVKDSIAGSYVSKYVSKCVGFRGDIKKAFYDRDGHYHGYKAFRKDHYRQFCRHYQSLHFGDRILDSFDIEKHPDLLCPSPFHVIKSGKEKLYPISRYQFRKLTHDFNKDTMSWTLNDYGLYVKKLRLRSMYESLYIKFVRCTSPTLFGSLCGDNILYSSLSSDYIKELSPFGPPSQETFTKLFYYHYLNRFDHTVVSSQYYFKEPSIDNLLQFVDDNYYHPIDLQLIDDMSDLPFGNSSSFIPTCYLVYSKLYNTFVSLSNLISLHSVNERQYRDLKYKSFRDKMFNLIN